MKMLIESYGRTKTYESIEEYANIELDGSDYGKGAIEAVVYTAENNSQAIGRLLDHLASLGLVTAGDVGEIVCGYTPDQLKFVD